MASKKKNRDDYWLNRIKPFITRAWPRIGILIDPKISINLALMAIQLEKSFSSALKVIRPFLTPVIDLSFFLHHLRNSDLLNTEPEAVFELLSLTFSSKYQWPDDSFREILNFLADAAPELKEHVKYKEIDEYLIQKGL